MQRFDPLAEITASSPLIWHHYFDDMAPGDVDGWGGFFFRTAGVLLFAAVLYWIFYYGNFGHWGLGNHHMGELADGGSPHGESLVWNFAGHPPCCGTEWFFHKWLFYVHTRTDT